MRAGSLILICAFAASLVSATFVTAGDITPASRPNVIVILLDDVGYGDFSCHGNPVCKTPNIDRLYGESARLADFHVCPMCTPTRGQLMTGRHCLSNGAMNVSSGRTPLRTDIPTMADVFRANSYRTGHFGKWHLGDNYPYRPHERGFHETVHCKSWGIGSAAEYWNNDCIDDIYWHKDKAEKYPGYNTDVFFAEAIKWMKAANEAKKPFFLYLPTTAAHGPLFVPEKYTVPYRQQKQQIARFFGMIANIDENLGKLDAWLKAEKLFDNTLVVFMTDNGGTAGVPVHNAGMRGRKTELYEGGHRVPCFVRWPAGKLRAGEIAEPTQCQDWLPTLIDLCTLAQTENAALDGISLAKRLRGEQDKLPDRTLVVQYSRIGTPRPQKGDACIIWNRWRLIRDQELYDLTNDPGQKQNVLTQNADTATRMRTEYDRWWATVEPGLDTFRFIPVGADAANPVDLSPCDWQDVHCDQSLQTRRGDKKNGLWNINVERDGEYEVTLRRWPKAADLAVTAASAVHKGPAGQIAAGVAMPIAKARLKIGGVELAQAVQSGDKAASFTVKLKTGKTQLQTWFYDGDDNELCGAYYTEVHRK